MAEKKNTQKKSRWDADALHFVPVDPAKIQWANKPSKPTGKKRK